MTRRPHATAQWWSALAERSVTFLTGVDPELLAVALDPLPPGAPAVVPSACLRVDWRSGGSSA